MAIKIADLAKTASRTSYVKESVRKELNKMGLSQYRTVSDARAKQVAEALKEAGAVKTYRSASQMVRETQKSLAERNKQEEAPKLTKASLREERKIETGNKAQVAQVEEAIHGNKGRTAQPNAQSSASGQNVAHSASQLQETRTSAGPAPKKFSVKTTTSIVHANEAKDLAID